MPAINNHAGFGRWAFIEVADPWDAQNAIRKGIALLLLAHLYANPGTVLLLDKPDAHLEILRQRQSGKIAVKVINHYGDEVLKVFEI